MFVRKCKITFIAHGSTVYSESRRLCDGSSYPPLNEDGYNQILKIAEFIKKRGVKNDRIFTSPALRTLQSAEILSKELKTDFEILEKLTSRDFGKWSGMTYEQIEDLYPEVQEKVYANILVKTPEDGEPLADFNTRIKKIISNIVEENKGMRILVVTHPIVIRSAICSAFNIPLESQGNIFVRPGSATQISYFEDWASLIYSGYMPVL